jgi:hypothetical protein
MTGADSESVTDSANPKLDLNFKPDLTAEDWTEKYRSGIISRGPYFLPPIETLSPTKTVGVGRTNVTLIMATLVQTDVSSPPAYASFDYSQTPSRQPTVQVHFLPSAYGFSAVGTYYMEFSIYAAGATQFDVEGYAGAGALSGNGTKSANGAQTLTLIFSNLPASQEVYGSVTQLSSGPSWNWYSTSINRPPAVFEP